MTTTTPHGSGMRSRPFTTLVTSWSFENIADSLLMVIFAVWIADLTGNPGLASTTFAVFGLPAFAAPFLGRLADRVSRRKMFATLCFIGAASLVPLLFLTSPSQFWWIYASALVYATVAFGNAGCRAGLLRDLLADNDLGPASSLLQSIDQVLRLALPFVAAGIYMWTGPIPIVWAAIACFALAGLVMLALRFDESAAEEDPDPFWRSLTAGFRHIAQTTPLNRLTTAMVLATCTSALTSAVGFAILENVGVEAAWMGPIEAVGGLGGLAAGAAAAVLMKRFGRPRLVALGICLIAIGALPMLGTNVWLFAVGTAFAGAGFTAAIIAYLTEVQIRTPARLQGRTTTTADTVMQLPRVALTAGGAAMLGILDARWIVVIAILLCAVATVTAAFIRNSPVTDDDAA